METYSISVDFGNVRPYASQLHNEIILETGIVKNLIGITIYQDTVDIEFDFSLSGGEKTLLDAIVSSHIPLYNADTPNSLNIVPKKNTVNSNSYTRIAANIFNKTKYAIAKSVSYCTGTSYDIQIYDKENKQILLSKNLTNNEESIQDLGILTNLPSSSTQIKISIKTNGEGTVYMENIIICYN